jgi:hypothetical protein
MAVDDSDSLSSDTSSDSSSQNQKKRFTKEKESTKKQHRTDGKLKTTLKGKKQEPNNLAPPLTKGSDRKSSTTKKFKAQKYESDLDEDSSGSFDDPLVGVTKEVSKRSTLDRTTSTSSATRKVTGGAAHLGGSKSKERLISEYSESDSSIDVCGKSTSPTKPWVKQANGSWAHGSTTSISKGTPAKGGTKKPSSYDSDSDEDSSSVSDDSKRPNKHSSAKRSPAVSSKATSNMARFHSSVPVLKSPLKSFKKKSLASDSESSIEGSRQQTKKQKDVARKVPQRTKSFDTALPTKDTQEKINGKKKKKKKKKKSTTTTKKKKTKEATKARKAPSSSSSSDSDDSLDVGDIKKANVPSRTSPVRSKSLPLGGGKAKPTPNMTDTKLSESQSSLNASSSRITIIDPTSRAFPKLDRPPLPDVEGEPDWLFKPKDGQRPSILGIASSMDFKDRSIDSFLEKLRSASAHGDEEQVVTGPKEKLFKLLNHDPSWADERKKYRDEEARQVILESPEVAKEKYMFSSGKEKIFPFPCWRPCKHL